MSNIATVDVYGEYAMIIFCLCHNSYLCTEVRT